MIEFQNEVYDLSISGIRRLLHQEIEEAFAELYEPDEEAYEELEKAHELISAQDAKGLAAHDIAFEIFFYEIAENDLLAEALEAAGYKVDQSNISKSLYVLNDHGEEVRIADHKRPAYQVSGQVGYTDHEYSNQLIAEDNKITKQQLEHFNINLSKEEYFLG